MIAFLITHWRLFLTIGAAGIIATAAGCHIQADARRKRDLADMTTQRDQWRDNARSWQAYGRAEKAAYEAQAALRASEAAQAVQSLSAAQKSCSARVAEARRSSLAIKELVDAPAKPGSASRLLDSDSLRDALGAGKPAAAPGGR